jgi:phenylpropionate dioxygenase-like ring-hydroxylating dioxygenase large terminal subunit
MRCQYHGWEYGEDGRTRHIPQPKNFVPLDRDEHRLPTYRLECCGQLVFVSLAEQGPSLRDHLGDLYPVCVERFGPEWEPFLAWEPAIDVNWKIPVENSLEAYHVPCVHPDTFREDPGESRSEHLLGERHTAFGTSLPFSAHSRLDTWYQRSEGWLLRRLGSPVTGRYWQHHVFPNLLFSFTDAVSLCNCVVPAGPVSSRAVVRQFGRVSPVGGARRWLARRWGQLAAVVTRRILAEDLGMYGDIQRGLCASPQRGVLGRCEERIFVFQDYVRRMCERVPGDMPDSFHVPCAAEAEHD